jgi:anti-sigma factor ChrR (cupin superfamily)
VHGDLDARVCVDTRSMQWTKSPSATVWRKRLHHVGPSEAGQVTSVVRYEPRSAFPRHGHPDGEEILVLEGIFSDEHGDWPAGTYLLNPQGVSHAPFSLEGCTLFVKLRQHPGDRQRVAIDSTSLPWQPGDGTGIEVRLLHADPAYLDSACIERWAPGTEAGLRAYAHGVELLVLEGGLEDEQGHYSAGTWLRLPRGALHRPCSLEGCQVYVKRAALAYLRTPRAIARLERG